MQITETTNEGLKRTLKVVVGKDELGERFTARLDQVKDNVQLKGFRKGKVPVPHLKKVFGRSLMAEVLQETVRDTSSKAIADRKERPALQPSIELPEDQAEIEKVISGEADLSYSMSFEVIPAFTLADVSTLKLERLVADVEPEALDNAINELVERSINFTAEEGRAATDGDRVTIDYVGKIDGEPFPGGADEGAFVVLGKANFIPGFEDGLKGAKAGEQRTVNATFPEAYPEASLAGKAATFDVTVKEVAAPQRPAIDDEFAKSLGVESLDKLKELVSAQIGREYEQVSRNKLKRELLDALDKAHEFELPPSLVEFEFNNIWRQLTETMERQNRTFADEEKSEDEIRAEYRKIAERRVRLGLVVGDIGEKNNIQVSQDELRRALIEQTRRFPGREKMVYEYFEKTPGALAELRAPIFEDKVVDFVLQQVKPVEKKVSKEELMKQAEDVSDS
jgi:trigger factor